MLSPARNGNPPSSLFFLKTRHRPVTTLRLNNGLGLWGHSDGADIQANRLIFACNVERLVSPDHVAFVQPLNYHALFAVSPCLTAPAGG